MYKKSELIYTVLHVPFDLIMVTLAFVASYWLRGNGLEIYKLPWIDYVHLLYVAVPLWIIIYALQGMYTQRYLFGTLQNMAHLAVSSLAGWASFVVYLVFLKNEQTLVFPRLMLVYILILSFIFVFGGRLVLRFIQFLARVMGYGRKRVLILGEGDNANELESFLKQNNDPSLTFITRLETTDIDELVQQLKTHKIDELVIADHHLMSTKVLELIIAAQNAQVICNIVPNLFEVQASNVTYTTLAGLPLMTFRQTPLDGWGRVAKRIFDIIMSLFGLVVLSPVFLIVGFVIKMTDPGPMLYGHERIGRDGKKFRLYKFRSMITKYSTGPGFNPKSQIEIFTEMGRMDLVEEFKRDQKVKDDPRVSKIGKLLRKTRLDELPQLINVLRGDLSLVGPRPIVDAELPRYGRWASYLLSIKPGMTGLWQVSGGNDVSYDERVKLDATYVQNWSLRQDLIIIIKTFMTIVGGKSAY